MVASGTRTFLLLAWLCMCPPAAAVAQPQAPDAQASKRVRLVFDEQNMSDAVRAEVYKLIADSVPESEWPTLQLTSATSVLSLLNEYFDIYSTGDGKAPRTQKVLADMIAGANERVSSVAAPIAPGAIQVPPVPIRAYSRYAKNEVASRRFDPEAMTYETRSAKGVMIERRGDSDVPRVDEALAFRRGKTTAVVLSVNASLRRRVQAIAASQAVIALDDAEDDTATVRLLAQDPAATCDSATTWLASSPYRSSMKLGMTPAAVAQIEARAVNVPLTVIDWNVKGDGHGAKVRAVVKEVLHELGLDALDQHVKEIELNPVRNRDGLRVLLATYKAKVVAKSPDMASIFTPAEQWVEAHVPLDENSSTQKVPSLLLQAIFSDQFMRPQALNFSFTTDSVALTILDSQFMGKAMAFAAFAAGNSGLPASPLLKPQAEAFQWPTVVNVTHGRADGAIDGDITNDKFKVIVSLVAPGCGYTTAPLRQSDIGSSFASPYVATAAWVRMLQGVPAAAIKRSLITASLPASAVGKRVESGGLFDPALFFLEPAPHMLTSQGAFLELSSLKFKMTYEADGVDITITAPALQSPSHIVTFQPCTQSSDLCVTVRRWLKDNSLWMTTGTVKSFEFEAASGQQKIEATDAAALLKLIRLVTF